RLTPGVSSVTICGRAVAYAPGRSAGDPDPAPRRRLAEAPADGRRALARIRLDPPGDRGDQRAVRVARAGSAIRAGRGHAAPRGANRDHAGRASDGALSHGRGPVPDASAPPPCPRREARG